MHIGELWRRLLYLFRRRRFEADLEEELQFHVAMTSEALRESGVDSAEAGYAARRRLGNPTRLRESAREAWGWRWLDAGARDARFALRMMRRNPGYTAVALLTLAFGIGANTAIFTAINAVMLRPLPYRQPERVLRMECRTPRFPELRVCPYIDVEGWRAHSKLFESVAAMRGDEINLTGPDRSESLQSAAISGGFFQTLGAAPALGRDFSAAEHQPGRDRVVILSDTLWRSHFGGDRGILGRVLQMDGQPRVVVGVAPPGFAFPGATNVWTPLVPPATIRQDGFIYEAAARLRPGVSLSQAQAVLDSVSAELGRRYPEIHAGLRASGEPLRRSLAGDYYQTLLLLLGAVGCVLLVCCANLSNLQLARLSARRREMAARAALGAGRARLAGQLFVESALLGLCGGGAGLLLFAWTRGALLRLLPESAPTSIRDAGIDSTVLLFAAAASLLAALLFGLAPALEGTRPRFAGRGTVGGGARLRSALVAGEIAVTTVLAIGGGLLFHSFLRLQAVDPGFHPDHVVSASVSLPKSYNQAGARSRYFDAVVARLAPGYVAGAASPLPFSGGWYRSTIEELEGHPATAGLPDRMADIYQVTPGYFAVLRIPLLRGRLFSAADTAGAPPVALIDERMAQAFWPGENPVGKRFRQMDHWRTVVGVVGHVKSMTLARDPGPQLYLPFAQSPQASAYVLLRTAGEPGAAGNAIARAAQAEEKFALVENAATMQERVSASTAGQRMRAVLVALFAAIVLLVAAAGVYGVTSFLVAQRAAEVGVRMALGATPGAVIRLILKQGGRMVVVGLAAGIAGAFAVTRLLAAFLYGVSPHDPLVFAGIAALLAAAALAALLVPARRAARIDPVEALRCE